MDADICFCLAKIYVCWRSPEYLRKGVQQGGISRRQERCTAICMHLWPKAMPARLQHGQPLAFLLDINQVPAPQRLDAHTAGIPLCARTRTLGQARERELASCDGSCGPAAFRGFYSRSNTHSSTKMFGPGPAWPHSGAKPGQAQARRRDQRKFGTNVCLSLDERA